MKNFILNQKFILLFSITVLSCAAIFYYTKYEFELSVASTLSAEPLNNLSTHTNDQSFSNFIYKIPINVNHASMSIDPLRLKNAIKHSATYIMNYCNEDGSFLYRTNLNPTIKVKRKYNMLRHAGAIYALAMYETNNPTAQGKEALKRSIAFLKNNISPVASHDNLLAVWSSPTLNNTPNKPVQVKLGGTGIALLALCMSNKIIPSLTSQAYLNKMGNLILFMQKPDGSFYSKYIPSQNGLSDRWTSLYYPGEAALGLLCLYEIDKSPRWLNAAAKALAYLAEKRSKHQKVEADHWALLATAKLLPHYDKCTVKPIPENKLVEHAVKIVKSMLSGGINYSQQDLEYGCFVNDGRTCPTAIRLEGLLASLSIIPKTDTKLRTSVKSRINTGISFLLNTQVLSGPYRGGFPRAAKPLANNHPNASQRFNNRASEVRIDYVQHALCALLQYREFFLKNTELLVKSKCQPTPYALIKKSPVTLSQFPQWIKSFTKTLNWPVRKKTKKLLTSSILKNSLDAGKAFMINNQTEAGNFNYIYNFITNKVTSGDSQVRQAGALWGLALIYQYDKQETSRIAFLKAMDFFLKHTVPTPAKGGFLIKYPANDVCKTGTVALTGLAIIDFLRTENELNLPKTDKSTHLNSILTGYINYLQSLLLANNHFADSFSFKTQTKSKTFSPYFDGESLLCLIKAAKYLGYNHLIPFIEKTAPVLAHYYTVKEWETFIDSSQTKGFSQWGTMSFCEYAHTNWKNAETYQDCALSLAWWLMVVHQVNNRARNTAYAFEALTHAYALAKTTQHKPASDSLKNFINNGLYKLTTWQVNGPLAKMNNFLVRNPTTSPKATGGVMNGTRDPNLRIDVTQHQMHSVILALRLLYLKK